MRHFVFIIAAGLTPFSLSAQEASEEDKGYLTNLIEENLSGSARDVDIYGFEGALSSEATIERLTVADSEGIWLTLEDITLDWNRSALFRGVIDVTELSARRIDVARAPVSEADMPSPEAQPFSLPELPVSLQLDKLDITEITLGEPILGMPIAVALTGSASLADGEGTATITAQRIDGREGEFVIDGSFDNADRTLALDLSLTEEAGGIAATLLDLPGAPAVALSVAGTGPLDDYNADVALATDGEPRLSGSVELLTVEGRSSFAVDLGGDITSLFAPEYQEFFGPDVQLIAQGAQTVGGGYALNTLELTAQNLRLTGAATFETGGWPTQLSISGTVADTDGDIVLLPLAGEKTYVDRIDLNIGYDADISDDWSGAFTIAGLDRPGLLIRETTLDATGIISKPQDGETATVTANLSYAADGLQLDDEGASEALGETVSGVANINWSSGNPTRIDQLTLTGPGIEVRADAVINGPEDGLRTQANILLDVDALERFSTLAGRDLDGAAELALVTTIIPLDGLFDIIATGQTNDLQLDVVQLDPLLEGQGDLSVLAVRDTEGTRLEALSITTDAASVTADANLTSSGSNAQFDIKLVDIGLVLPELQGPATVSGTVNQNAEQTIAFDILASAPDLTLTADGTVNPGTEGQTINVDLQTTIADLATYRQIMGQDLSGAASVELSGVLLSDGKRFNATISATTDDLQTGYPQIDPLLSGNGRLVADIARTAADRYRISGLALRTPYLTVDADARGGLEGPASASVDATILDATRIAPGLDGALTLSAQADRATDETTTVSLKVGGPGTEIALDADIAAPDDDYRISGTLNADIEALGAFQRLVGQPISGSVDLAVEGSLLPDLTQFAASVDAQTNNIGIGNSSVDILLAGGGSLSGSVSRAGDDLEVSNLVASTANISLNADLAAQGDTGSGTFNLRLRDIGLYTDTLSGPIVARGTATRQTGQWGVNVDATGPGGIAAQIDGTISDEQILNLAIDGSAPLGLANPIIAPRRLSGLAQFDLSVNGPPELNSVSGQISTNGTRLAAPSLGQALENINGAVALSNGSAQISLDADVETGGSIAINGPVTLSAPYDANLTARLDRVVLRDPNLYETNVTGNISLDGGLTGGARISGALTLGQTDVQVPSSGIGALGDLPDVTHIGAPADVRRTLQRADALGAGQADGEAGNGGPVYPLDITVNAPSRIFIRGRGLDAELGGQLTLGGTTQNIIPVGQFDLIRGRLDILQQRFQLTEGSASLQGDFTPYIRLVAETEARTGTTVRIIVEGPANEPEVTFESTPDLPQDEVLSQLIFGRDISEISPLQAVQLAAAVGTLAGRGGGGLIDNFRQGVGLDDFDITTDDEGNAALRAGKYLSENVYTDVTVASDGSTDVNINLDLTENITAKGSVADDGETSIGIFYERDY